MRRKTMTWLSLFLTVLLSVGMVGYGADLSANMTEYSKQQYKEAGNKIGKATVPAVVQKLQKEKPKYTFSKNKVNGAELQVFVEGKGYVNFGKNKPFISNGELYYPLKDMAKLDGQVLWSEKGGVIKIAKYYNEENSMEYSWHLATEEPMEYVSSVVTTIKPKSNKKGKEIVYDKYYHLTKEGIDYIVNGGAYVEDYRKQNKLNPIKGYAETYNYDLEKNTLIVNNGVTYIQVDVLTSFLVTPVIDVEGVLHLGSEEYVSELYTNQYGDWINNPDAEKAAEEGNK